MLSVQGHNPPMRELEPHHSRDSARGGVGEIVMVAAIVERRAIFHIIVSGGSPQIRIDTRPRGDPYCCGPVGG